MFENHKPEIRNLIFDLGGVLLNINPLLSLNAFARMSGISPEALHDRLASEHIFEKLETGSITPAEFRHDLCNIMGRKFSDDAIDEAWNVLLLDFPVSRVKMLQQLRKNYRIFLLSNTNSIHFQHYTSKFYEIHGLKMTSLFDKLYLSYEIGLHKPDKQIFLHLLEKEHIVASESVFIDDSLPNINTAASLGIHTIHITGSQDVTNFFKNGKLN